MSLILRIDVDRPYGKQGFVRHLASRLTADWDLPIVPGLNYLAELKSILQILNSYGRPAYVFFRQCSLPNEAVCRLMDAGGHCYGLHLEDSRSYETFAHERELLEAKLGRRVNVFSKHGSGVHRYGHHHYPPYEPQRYLSWARQSAMRVLFGNQEDPTVLPKIEETLVYFPAAFWLEPAWRDTQRFSIEWLINEAQQRDVVMLLHPDNVMSSGVLRQQFLQVVQAVTSRRLCTS